MKLSRLKSLGGLLLLLANNAALAADDVRYTFTPYAWATDLDTTAGGENKSANSQIDFDDLLPIVDAAWMSMFEAKLGNWSLMNDVVYMKISEGAKANGPLGFFGADVKGVFEQGTIDLMAGYTADNSPTTLIAGLRYLFIEAEADLDITGPLPAGGFARNGSRDENWIDPVIGVRHLIAINDKWTATLQADVGGGIDSEFSSISTATLNYRFSDSVTLRGGYRYARIDKDDSEVLFDQTSQGFLLAAAFNF